MIIGDLETLILQHQHKKIAVLSFQKSFSGLDAPQLQLSPRGDLAEAAQRLFATLRQLGALPIEVILAEWMPEEGLGRAINDRLRRAAAS
jgi:L-threonylcarbamoyladenylate synthase